MQISYLGAFPLLGGDGGGVGEDDDQGAATCLRRCLGTIPRKDETSACKGGPGEMGLLDLGPCFSGCMYVFCVDACSFHTCTVHS